MKSQICISPQFWTSDNDRGKLPTRGSGWHHLVEVGLASTDPYEEKSYRGAGIKEVQAWWKKCKDWMARFKDQSQPFVYDFKELLKALSGKEAEAQSEVDAFMENCAKRWQTREGTCQATTSEARRKRLA